MANVVLGDLERAIAGFEAALRESPADADVWSNFSVALLERGRAANDPRLTARAAYAASRALAFDPEHPQAAFNRALALQRLGCSRLAAQHYDDAAAAANDRSWAAEARRRGTQLSQMLADATWLSRETAVRHAALDGDDASVREHVLRSPQAARTTAETIYLGKWGAQSLDDERDEAEDTLRVARAIGTALRNSSGENLLSAAVAAIDRAYASSDSRRVTHLARGHRTYDEARKLYSQRVDIATARQLLLSAAAEFKNGGSPMELAALHYAAIAAFDLGNAQHGEAALQNLLPSLGLYPALRAQTLSQLGTIVGHQGLFARAIEYFKQAEVVFDQLGERDNARTCRAANAALLGRLGRVEEAWRRRAGILESSGYSSDERPLKAALADAGFTASEEKEWEAALTFLSVASELEVSASPIRHAELLMALARAQAATGSPDATSSLARARIVAETVKEPARGMILAAVAADEARIWRQADPRRAHELLNAAIRTATDRNHRAGLVDLYLERALTVEQLGREDDALSDLQAAAAFVERQAEGAPDVALQFVDSERVVYGRLAVLLARRGDARGAFETAERGRVQRRFGRQERVPETLSRVQSALRPGTLLIHLTAVDDSLLVIPVTARGSDAFVVQRGSQGDGPIDAQAALDSIRGLLSVATSIIVVPDDHFASVPFAALRHPAGGIVADHVSTVVAPDATRFVHSSGRPIRGSGTLVVGDPQFDAAAYATLPRLPEAAIEALEVGRLYPDSRVLLGSEATGAALLREVPGRQILHIASHAEINSIDPLQSALLLTPEETHRGAVTVHDILDAANGLSLTVLAACRTADGGRGRLAGSLAAAFLAAGSRNVVGTLWDVEDTASRSFSLALHELLLAGVPPAEAVRKAQLRLRTSQDPRLNDPKAWSAFQLYGSG